MMYHEDLERESQRPMLPVHESMSTRKRALNGLCLKISVIRIAILDSLAFFTAIQITYSKEMKMSLNP